MGNGRVAVVEPYGRMYDDKAMFLREFVGEAESEDGKKYEMSLNLGGMCPIIHSKQSGRYFTISWQDIINMAVDAGIDEEGDLIGAFTDDDETDEEAEDEDEG